jgi:hypothetical protein
MVSSAEKKLKLNKDIKIIVDVINRSIMSPIISIILYGSYGRGEGAYFKKNNQVFVYNDYDILVIVKEKLSESDLNYIKKELLQKIEIKWIDISQKLFSELGRLKPSILNFDLKYGSSVIYGDQNVFDQIPLFRQEQITLLDVEILYFTRLYPFLITFEDGNFDLGYDEEKIRFFRNQLSKAVLAIVDSKLIRAKKYNSSYKIRSEILKAEYSKCKEIISLSNWALEEKMYPKGDFMSPFEMKKLFFKILNLYFDEMHLSLSLYYGKKIKTTEDLVIAKKYSIKQLIKQLKVLIVVRSLKSYRRKNRLLILQSYTLEILLKEEIESKAIFNNCLKLIRNICPKEVVNCTDYRSLIQVVIKLSR